MAHKDKQGYEYKIITSYHSESHLRDMINLEQSKGWQLSVNRNRRLMIEHSKPFFGREKWQATIERKK